MITMKGRVTSSKKMCDTVRQWTSLQYIHFNIDERNGNRRKIAGLFLPDRKGYLNKTAKEHNTYLPLLQNIRAMN